MSLSADDRVNIWQEHSHSLSRIRTELRDTPVKSRTPVRSPGGRASGRQSHSPYGKYRQNTPPYLPRLNQTPEHEKTKLRGNRYGVVPPVNRRSSRSQPEDDYDSWGEESDEEEEEQNGQYLPYAYPMQPYPMGPPAVVFGQPFPMYYPPQPNMGANNKRRRKGDRDPKADVYRLESPKRGQKGRYEDVNRSVPSKARKPKKQNRSVHFPPENGFHPGAQPMYPTAYPMYNMDHVYAGNQPQRYKYIHPRDTPFSPSENDGLNVYRRFKDEPDRLVDYYYRDHPLFAENFVNWFINECLDDLIPDLLIDSFNDLDKVGELGTPLHDVRDTISMEVVTKEMNSVVRETLSEMVNEYMLFKDSNKDPLEAFLTRLVDDAVTEATTDVVKETVREMAREYVTDKHVDVFFDDVFYDLLDLEAPILAEEVLFDLVAEDFIEEHVIRSELEEEIPIVAKEVLSHYDTKVMRRELKEVSSHAGDKLMESIVLEYLLSLVARQGYVWTESDHANKHMDDMITNLLMEQLLGVTQTRRKTVNCKPLKKLHEKVVTDVALDVLLQQLTATLDEDLLDVDEYERGVTEPATLSFNSVSKYR